MKNAKDNDTKSAWLDPDEAPELTAEWFEAAYQYQGDVMIKRGQGRRPVPIKNAGEKGL